MKEIDEVKRVFMVKSKILKRHVNSKDDVKSRNDGISGRSSCEGNVCGTKKVVAIDAGIVEAVFVVGTVKRENQHV